MATAVIYPAYDAAIRHTGTVWATVRDAATGSSIISASAATAGPQTDNKSDLTNIYIDRAGFTFDTSVLGTGAVVTGATLEFYLLSGSYSGGSQFITYATLFTPASYTSYATADFDQFGAAASASPHTESNAYSSAYKTWTLNSTGYGAINVSGYTAFGLRDSFDHTNSPPIANAYSVSTWYAVDETGTSKDPKLTVTYTPPPAGPLSLRRRPSGLYIR